MITSRSNFAEKLSAFPGIVFTDVEAARHRGQWRRLFQERIGSAFDDKIIFEIGCADADFLARVAGRHPHTAFIGLDWKCKALHDGAVRVATANLPNVVLVRGRAQDLCTLFAGGELDEIWIFHPEPCDRPAELKNRLISAEFLQNARRVLSSGMPARLFLKTDHAEYFSHVLGLLEGSQQGNGMAGARASESFRIDARSADYWNDSKALAVTSGRAFAGQVTGYEARFRKKRRPIYYLELRPV